MKKEISTTITINARAEKVWNILTDFNLYPKWNPFITSITGNATVGRQIKVVLEPKGGNKMVFKPTVLSFEKNRSFSWQGRLLVKGLFDGEHRFLLTQNADGTTTLQQSESFSGLLVGLFSKSLDTVTKDGFIAMNEAIKKIAEAN